jgi:hypothetical protein
VAEQGWIRLIEYGTQLEADVAAATLRAAGVPVQIQTPVTGIFGPGYAGPTQLGVSLLVPADRVADARSILDEEPST